MRILSHHFTCRPERQARRAALLALLGFVLAAAPAFAAGNAGEHYGAKFGDAEAVALADVLEEPDRYARDAVKLKGVITDVCPKSGCWIVVSDGEQEIRVNFKDHSFSVPKNVAGRKVVVEGVSQKSRAARGAGKPPAVSLVATGVSIWD
jgi:hypothetical protein